MARHCEQCGRTGTRGFTTIPGVTLPHPTLNLATDPITICANKNACRKRWPKRPDEDA